MSAERRSVTGRSIQTVAAAAAAAVPGSSCSSSGGSSRATTAAAAAAATCAIAEGSGSSAPLIVGPLCAWQSVGAVVLPRARIKTDDLEDAGRANSRGGADLRQGAAPPLPAPHRLLQES
eukprot:COSAG02_NODE_19308_length_889_cov_1.141772_3_plen_119_part_01